MALESESGWWNQPTPKHPVLRMWYRGIDDKRGQKEGGFRVFDFQLDSHLGFLNGIQWATWDCLGQLLVARKGVLEKYTLLDLTNQAPQPTFSLDLNEIHHIAGKADSSS